MQALFDHTADSAAAGGAAAAAAAMLAELHVEGFDAEQIWGQLDMQVCSRGRYIQEKLLYEWVFSLNEKAWWLDCMDGTFCIRLVWCKSLGGVNESRIYCSRLSRRQTYLNRGLVSISA